MQKHWFVFINRPVNGHYSLKELDDALSEISVNTARVTGMVERMKRETAEARRVVSNVSSNHNN
jgi:hypothetical protein